MISAELCRENGRSVQKFAESSAEIGIDTTDISLVFTMG
jgi:hypothetical protein